MSVNWQFVSYILLGWNNGRGASEDQFLRVKFTEFNHFKSNIYFIALDGGATESMKEVSVFDIPEKILPKCGAISTKKHTCLKAKDFNDGCISSEYKSIWINFYPLRNH